MLTVIPYSIKIVNGKNDSSDTLKYSDICKYYKDEGGKHKCIRGEILEDERLRVIQVCKGVETDVTDVTDSTNKNKLYYIIQYIGYFEIRFNKVSRHVDNSLWCIEIYSFSLTNNMTVKRSTWINVMSKRKIPANIRLDPDKIIEFNKRKRESNVNAPNKRIKKIFIENSLLKQENSLLKKESSLLKQESSLLKKQIQNLELILFKIQLYNEQSIQDKFSNIPIDPELYDVNAFEWLNK